MTEFSYWWTTSGTPSGDQVSSYTQAHLSTISKILASCRGDQGVSLDDADGLLSGTVTGANTVQMSPGSAVVDGKPYKSDANVNVNIPSAVGGGNTRIDRIVLRASWSAFTVRITRIAGTDAASPTVPSITETSGTTYDIKLYQALVDTSGNVTLTDERDYAGFNVDNVTMEFSGTLLQVKNLGIDTAQIADDAITQAKIDAGAVGTTELANDSVDDAKVGNRVPKLTHRQGGHSTFWDVVGTTTYTPTTLRVQIGAAGGAGGYTDVTFPVAFASGIRPLVFVTLPDAATTLATCVITNLTNTGFRGKCFNFDGSASTNNNFFWLAIGAE